MVGTSKTKIAAIAALSVILPESALTQSVQQGVSQRLTTGVTPTRAARSTRNTGGTQVDIGVGSTLRFDDNFELVPNDGGNTSIFDTNLSVGLSSITSVHNFNLTGTGVFRYANIPGRTETGFEDPTVRLNYSTSSLNSRLTVTGRYRDVDRDFLDPFEVEREEQASSGLFANGGSVRSRNIGATWQTGMASPIGFTLAGQHSNTNYIDTFIPRLFDVETNSGIATLTGRISPVTQLRTSFGLTDYEAEDIPQTERLTTDYAVGVVQNINPTLVLDAQIGYTEVETDTTGGTQNRSGGTGAFTLTQTLPTGSLFANGVLTRNENGSRATFRLGRSLALPNGSLSGSIGFTDGSGGSSKPIVSLNYLRQIGTDDFSISVDRIPSTNNTSQDIIDTRIALGYGHVIDSLSRFDVIANLGRSESSGTGGAPTIDRANLSATYTRTLTSDWDMTGGILLRYQDDPTAGGEANSNAVFVTLGRNFSFRP